MSAILAKNLKFTFCVCVVFLLALVAVACDVDLPPVDTGGAASDPQPTTPPPATGFYSGTEVISNDGLAPSAVDLIYADSGQCSTLFDLNMPRTERAVDHNLFWTWHLNFNLQPTNMPGVDFFGCLHFSWRDDRPHPFHPADEYILTPCHIVNLGEDLLSWSPVPQMYSSLEKREVNGTHVHFPGESHVECDLDLGEYGADFAASAELRSEVTSYWSSLTTTIPISEGVTMVQDELNRLRNELPMYYPSFSLGGVAADLGKIGVPRPQPLIFYHPNACSSPSECLNFWFDPLAFDYPNIKVQGGIGAQEYEVISQSSCGLNPQELCDLAQNEGAWFYIMEYGQKSHDMNAAFNCTMPTPPLSAFLLFHATRMSSDVLEWWKWCPENITPDISSVPSPNGLEDIPPFWTRDTTIFVGYNPVDDVHMDGELFEVWLDPDGSGTQGSGDE